MEKKPAEQSAGREETGKTVPQINKAETKLSVSPPDIELLNKPDNFFAGKVKCYVQNWENLTNDRYILDIVRSGYKLELDSWPTSGSQYPIHFNEKEKEVITSLIDGLVEKRVIEKVQHEKGEIISNIFIRPKQDGTYRLILNLKKLNQHIEKIHFKMETLKSALNMVKRGVYFAKIDLKDAYYSIAVAESDRKFLRFVWGESVYQYTCLPNGLASAPRIFTKVLKPTFSSLRKLGHENVIYIDDSLLASDSIDECNRNIEDTVKLIDSLGLTMHPEKSIMIPPQTIEFVGFVLNSNQMTVTLSDRKANDIQLHCINMIKTVTMSIRDFSKLVGKLVAAEPGVKYTPLHYKPLELQRDLELKKNRGNFDKTMTLSQQSTTCFQWWVDNVKSACRPISIGTPKRKIETDSSMSGYGGYDVTNGIEINGHWNESEQCHHINYLELKAAFLCLKSFCSETRNEHIQMFLDNTVALKYLSKMGGRKLNLNELARDIWLWCEARNIWLSAYHIPGKLNTKADALSRFSKKLNDDMEWSLNETVFNKIELRMGKCDIDLFASAKNRKTDKYVSFIPDLRAYAVNAFSLTWTNALHYIFPPFSMLGAVLQKIRVDQAHAILIAPLFTTQPWFPQILQLICDQCYILP